MSKQSARYPTFEDESLPSEERPTYRIRRGVVDVRQPGSRFWEGASRQSLLQHAVDSPLWGWLRRHGITRPSPPGQTAEEDRSTTQVKLRLSHEAADTLDDMAKTRGMTKSRLVEIWIERESPSFLALTEQSQKRRDDEKERTRQELLAAGEEVEADIIGDHERLLAKRAKG